jgi:hypothetical protein
MKYYNISKLMNTGGRYLICFGERSNGKTFQALLYGLKEYLTSGNKVAIIRRFREDFKGKRGGAYWDNLCYDGSGKNHVKELTKGKYDAITYYAGKWYLAYYDNELQKYITQPEPFAYAFALTEMEHEKGNTYAVGTIIFDEFMTRGTYLPDEFIAFTNTISTLVRSRSELNGRMIRVIMCANTVSKYCPYFDEFGIGQRVRAMKQGEIAIFNYGDSGLKVAVEYCDSPNTFKPSDVFFAFENEKLKMITQGYWELDFYPHLKEKHEEKDIKCSYFIVFQENILQADIIIKHNAAYTFIHRKTTPIKYEDKDIIFTTEANHNANYFGRLTKPVTKTGKKIYYFFVNNKVFYSSNEVGEIMSHYLEWSNGLLK